jgi:hypothetical protein
MSPVQDTTSLIPNKLAVHCHYVTGLSRHIRRHIYIVSDQNSRTVAKLQQESLMLTALSIVGQKFLNSGCTRCDNLSRLLSLQRHDSSIIQCRLGEARTDCR